MADSKITQELLIKGAMEFDKGSISAAAQFSQELVKVIEGPLQEMSKRVIEGLFGKNGLGQNLPGQSQLVQADKWGNITGSISPTTNIPPGQVTPPGTQSGSNIPPSAPPGAPLAQPPPPPPRNQYSSLIERTQQAISENRLINVSGNDAGDPRTFPRMSIPYSEASAAMLAQKMQRAGVDPGTTPEQKSKWSEMAKTIGADIITERDTSMETQKNYAKAIEETENTISKFNEALRKSVDLMEEQGKSEEEIAEVQKTSGAEISVYRQHLETLQKDQVDNAERAAARVSDMGKMKSSLEAPAMEDENRARVESAQRRQNIIKGVGIAGQALQMAGQLPLTMARNEAAYAGMEGMETRAAMSGDMNRLIAMQQLGGKESIMGTAGLGTAITGIGQMAGGAAISLLGGGPSSPVGLAGAGLALGGANKMLNFRQEQSQYAEGLIGAQQGKYQEYFQATGAARDRAKESFQTARQLGMPGAEGFLFGGSNLETLSSQKETSQKELEKQNDLLQRATGTKKNQGILESIGDMFKREWGAESTDPNLIRSKISNISGSISGINEMMPYAKEGQVNIGGGRTQSVNEYAAGRGISGQEVQRTLGEFAYGAGSRYMEDRSQDRIKERGQISKEMINMQSAGFSNVAGVVTGAMAGSTEQDPRKALNQVKDMWIEMLGAGLDKSKLTKVMENVGAQMGATYGGGASAQYALEKSMAFAQQIAGPGKEVKENMLGLGARIETGLESGFKMGAGGPLEEAGAAGTMKILGGMKGFTDAQKSEAYIALSKTAPKSAKELKDYLSGLGGKEFDTKEAEKLFKESEETKRGGAERYAGLQGGAGLMVREQIAPAENLPQRTAIDAAIKSGLSPQMAIDKVRSDEAKTAAAEGVKPTTVGGKAVAMEAQAAAATVTSGLGMLPGQISTMASALNGIVKTITDSYNRLIEESAGHTPNANPAF